MSNTRPSVSHFTDAETAIGVGVEQFKQPSANVGEGDMKLATVAGGHHLKPVSHFLLGHLAVAVAVGLKKNVPQVDLLSAFNLFGRDKALVRAVERLERHALALVAAAGEHQRTLSGGLFEERTGERRLADARAADDLDEARGSRPGGLQLPPGRLLRPVSPVDGAPRLSFRREA